MAAAIKTYELVTDIAYVEVPIRRTLYPDDKGATTFFRRDLETAPHLPLAVLTYVGHINWNGLFDFDLYAASLRSGVCTASQGGEATILPS